MELKILWLYHDVMDLYGDTGNICVLRKRCEDRGIKVTVDTCGIGENKDFNNYHLIFMGGGADKEQSILYEDLINKKDNIISAINNNTFILLICGGYQLFGKYYIDNSGNKIDGLGIFDYYTSSDENVGRCIGNVALEVNLDGDRFSVVGFENHGGQTHNVDKPFGKVLSGHGNEYQSQYEGYYDGHVLGTYVHGPLLPKNPKLADFIIKKSLSKTYSDVELEALDDELEEKGHQVILDRLNISFK